MNRLFSSLAVILGMLTAGSAANAATLTFVGEIELVSDGMGGEVAEIDYFPFTVLNDGVVTFTVDASGAGFMMSELDSFVLVAFDDGDRTADDFIAVDDDSGPDVDSFLSRNLAGGSYLAGVSSCCIIAEEFVAGVNSSVSSNPDNSFYRLTIDGDVSGVGVVPLPASGLLLAGPLLVAGISSVRRRSRRTT